jgi:hypothetical protein
MFSSRQRLRTEGEMIPDPGNKAGPVSEKELYPE